MPSNYPNATTIRRIAAMVYDFFLIIGIWMISVAAIVQLFNDGEAITGIGFQLFLFFELFAFYIFFWTFKGQSLGMQVWKIRMVDLNDEVVSVPQAFMRFFWATLSLLPFGLGFLWMMFNKERITFYDKASETRVIYLGNKPYESEKKSE